jgi:hypothetical protein
VWCLSVSGLVRQTGGRSLVRPQAGTLGDRNMHV